MELTMKLAERLSERAKLIANTNACDMDDLIHSLDKLNCLGKLLHSARQYLEQNQSVAKAVNIDEETLWLWENGLALPRELRSGSIMDLTWFYLLNIHKEGKKSNIFYLDTAITALQNALNDV